MSTMLSGWVSTTMGTTQNTVANKTNEGVACAAAEIVIDDVYSGAGSGSVARVIVRNSGGTDNLAITSAQLYDRIGHNFTSTSPLPISLNKGQMATINFTYPNFGMTANDSSTLGRNGTLIGGPTYSLNGKMDSALSFDGIDDYVLITVNGTSNLTGTMEIWVKPYFNGDNNFYTLLFLDHSNETADGNSNMLLYKPGEGSANIRLLFSNNDGSTVYEDNASTSSWSDGQWHHIAASWNSSGITERRTYLDGLLISRVLNKPWFITQPLNFLKVATGRFWTSNGWFFNGTIDEVALWNRTLTDAEINSTKDYGVLSINTTGLVGYWKFDEGRGILSCPSDFSRVVVTTNCGGVSAEFSKPPKC